MADNPPSVDRIASHPDDPHAPLADRLLLALGMWPSDVDEFGEQVVIDAAAIIRSNAHRFPMVCEDYGRMAEENERLRAGLQQIVDGDYPADACNAETWAAELLADPEEELLMEGDEPGEPA